MITRIATLTSLLFLASCGYIYDTSVQELTIETPGAHDARCFAYVDKVRYSFYPPQTKTVANSDGNLTVECFAPGNRQRTVVIEPTLGEHAKMNMLNGGVGFAIDQLSGALYKYPDIVYVDFTNMSITPEALPAQNNPDIPHPDSYDLEEFRPKEPRLKEDRDALRTPIKRRQPAKPLFDVAPVKNEPAIIEADK